MIYTDDGIKSGTMNDEAGHSAGIVDQASINQSSTKQSSIDQFSTNQFSTNQSSFFSESMEKFVNSEAELKDKDSFIF